MSDFMTTRPLARRIGLPLLTCYGLGTILGAGIYVLIGKVAGSAGMYAPLSFLLAAVVAGITALSYCQLVVLFPRSSGEAYYVEAGFNHILLTKVVGYLVVFTGIVSAATLANGFLGYLSAFINIPRVAALLLLIGLMGTIALWGIAESLWIAALITFLEVAGLIWVIFLAGDNLLQIPEQFDVLLIPENGQWIGVMAGAFLAFYAFIGFEDMVNIVEEVKQPEINMPVGIVLALVISTLLYFLIALIAVLGLPLSELSQSDAPIYDLIRGQHPQASVWIALISLLAIVNGVLTQIIMGSRVLYGLSVKGRAPSVFSAVSEATRTPWVATICVSGLTVLFAIWLPLEQLAKTTSFIILCVFTLVNLALWKVKKTHKSEINALPIRLPSLPLGGALLCIGLIMFQLISLV
jgi:amino acid transporter